MITFPEDSNIFFDQNLALNPTKVSGGCGRLLCCLAYENDNYKELRTKFPPLGTEIQVLETGEKATILKCDILNQTLQVKTHTMSNIETHKL